MLKEKKKRKRSRRYQVTRYSLLFFLFIFLSISVFYRQNVASVKASVDETIRLSLSWQESEFQEGSAFHLSESESVSNPVRLKVSYESRSIRKEGYEPGELIITLKGIGAVNRTGVMEALVGADKEGEIKKRDWTYTWNRLTDTYTFVNNEAIRPNSVFSGYFELVWDVDARNSIHNYSQKNIQAKLYQPDSPVILSNTLSFTNETRADSFAVHIETQGMMGYEGLTENISNPDDYAFIRYNLGADADINSRGLKETAYIFDPDKDDAGTGAIVISPTLLCEFVGDGTYMIGLKSNSSASSIHYAMEDQYLFVAYPLASYGDKVITASIEKHGTYHEGDNAGNMGNILLAEATALVPIPSDFAFTDIPGIIYDFSKDTWYDKHVSASLTEEKGGDVGGARLRTGTKETFYLEGILNNPYGRKYTLEMTDDFLYILKNDGTYRELGKEEYEFESITVPSTSSFLNSNQIPLAPDTYTVSITAQSEHGITGFDVLLKEKEQVITLPDDTYRITVSLKDIDKSVRRFSIPVTVEFHIRATSDLMENLQDNLNSGQVVNTAFLKLYDENGDWLNDDFTKENYLDDTNLHLAEKDHSIYGSYLDRERDHITLYDALKSDYWAYTDVSEITVMKTRMFSTLTMGSVFQMKEDVRPDKFSLYSILPEGVALSGYDVPEDIWDVMSLSGLDLSPEALANACTPEIILDYKDSGRTYIALHFDLTGEALPQNGTILAEFPLEMEKSFFQRNSALSVRSAVLLDKQINEYELSKGKDNGSWGTDRDLYADIDRDGNLLETLSYGQDNVSYVYADSSQLQLSKYIKTPYSDGWVQDEVPLIPLGGEYSYKLSLKNGNSMASDIILLDVLETGPYKEWQGTFKSIDLSDAQSMGFDGEIWYSASTEAEEVGGKDWTTDKSSLSRVQSVAIDFGDGTLKSGEELNIYIHMTAPSDASLKGKKTENGFSASFLMSDAQTGNTVGNTALDSNFVQGKLSSVLKKIIVTKTDATDGSYLMGADFELIDEQGNIIAKATSNERGYAIFHDIPSDVTYILRESAVPEGYNQASDIQIIFEEDENICYVTVENTRKTGTIELYKVNHLDKQVAVPGAEYSLYASDGSILSTAKTDSNGKAVFTDVPWGSFHIKETASPKGYKLSDEIFKVTVKKENIDLIQKIFAVDEQEETSVHLQKYIRTVSGSATTSPLEGAIFALMKQTDSGEVRVGLYPTDENGRIDITDLAYGNYYFYEYHTPSAYEKAENISFSLSPEKKEVSLTVYNKQKSGSLLLIKKDSAGNMVAGAKFEVYFGGKSASNLLGTYKTDGYGNIQLSNLSWGTYYLKEVEAPDCYEIEAGWLEAKISEDQLQVELTCINETKKGTVVLTKTNEAGTMVLPNAVYQLFTKDGALLGNYTTNAKGQITVSGLEWGSYYFKELIAPTGYSLSDKPIRFSINALTAGMTQQLNAVDKQNTKSISITKQIDAKDVHSSHGTPVFLFKVEGTDVYGNAHTYFRMVSFDESYINAYREADGTVCQTVVIEDMMAGTYTVSEEESLRYRVSGITNISDNGTVSEREVSFNLTSYDTGYVTFINEKYEHQYFSDTAYCQNIIKKSAQLTALTASYGAEQVKAESTLDKSLLTVKAFFDDGTVKEITSGYTLSLTKFPNINGDYTVTVSYTVDGITRSDSFTVTLYGMRPTIVSLSAVPKSASSVKAGSSLTKASFVVTATYSDGGKEVLPSSNGYTISRTTVPSTEGNFTVTIKLNNTTYPNDGKAVSTTVTLKSLKTLPIMMEGADFGRKIGLAYKQIIFTDAVMPSGRTLGTSISSTTYLDVSEAGDESVVMWYADGIIYVSTQKTGVKVIANKNSSKMFSRTSSSNNLANIDLSMLDTGQATDMSGMFQNCAYLGTIDVSGFNTSNVVDMSRMFYNCTRTGTITFGDNFDTSSVTNMKQMFYQCARIKTLDLGWKFTTKNVTDMSSMFQNCTGLTLDASNWNVDKTTTYTDFNTRATKVTPPVWVN